MMASTEAGKSILRKWLLHGLDASQHMPTLFLFISRETPFIAKGYVA
jgi:hypothetical protein